MNTACCHRRCGGAVQPDRGSSRPPSRRQAARSRGRLLPSIGGEDAPPVPGRRGGPTPRDHGGTPPAAPLRPSDPGSGNRAGRAAVLHAGGDPHLSGATSTRSTGWGGAISPTAIPIRTSTSRSSRSRTSRRLGQDNAHGGSRPLPHAARLSGAGDRRRPSGEPVDPAGGAPGRRRADDL